MRRYRRYPLFLVPTTRDAVDPRYQPRWRDLPLPAQLGAIAAVALLGAICIPLLIIPSALIGVQNTVALGRRFGRLRVAA